MEAEQAGLDLQSWLREGVSKVEEQTRPERTMQKGDETRAGSRILQ